MLDNSVMITKKVFLVLKLVDDYTALDPIGEVSVFIAQQKFKALKNTSGFYVFFTAPERVLSDPYKLIVEAQYYSREEMDIDPAQLDVKNPLKNVILKPDSLYPFSIGSTLVRLELQKDGNKVQEAIVRAAVNNMVKAGIVTARRGEESITLQEIAGEIVPGDILVIKDGSEERCIVKEVLPWVNSSIRTFLLTGDLQNDHALNTPLAALIETTTDKNGEAVIYFRTIKLEPGVDTINIGLEVEVEGQRVNPVPSSVELAEGNEKSVKLELPPNG